MFLFGLFAVFGFLFAWCFLVVCGVVLPPFFTLVELHHTAIALRTQEASAVSASPAVLRIASKHLHNDLARAIEALEQKKIVFVCFLVCFFSGLCAWHHCDYLVTLPGREAFTYLGDSFFCIN